MADLVIYGGRVLSIQSHVVSGYVGNKAATFPLQLLGFDVDVLNSLQFGTHTGYGKVAGQKLGASDLLALIDNLEENGVVSNYTHLLSGYMGTPDFLLAMKQVVARLRKHNPKLVYVCDPVLGDNGRLYVPPELIAIYRDDIVPLATVLTPNQFELEQITGHKISSRAEALAAAHTLHARGVGVVVVTSLITAGEDCISVVGSSVATETHAAVAFALAVPVIEGYFTGTGDMFAALLLAWTHALPGDLKAAVQRALSTIRSALERTSQHANGHTDAHSRELRVVQSLPDILAPKTDFFKEIALQ